MSLPGAWPAAQPQLPAQGMSAAVAQGAALQQPTPAGMMAAAAAYPAMQQFQVCF